MSRTNDIISRAVQLIELDSQGKITNVREVCVQIEQEFQISSAAAFHYVTVEAKAVARASQGKNGAAPETAFRFSQRSIKP